MQDALIQVTKLSKTFSSRLGGLFSTRRQVTRAVDNISFTVKAGEMVGYLGPNGAGKSTTIKVLTGLLVPSGGDVRVNGFVPWQDRRRYVAGIGAVFGQRTTLWWDLPVRESLELLQHVYRVPSARFRKNLGAFSELLDLGPFLNTPVKNLSLGQRMRADLAAALLHEPALLFLDEPTIGLDVVARERIREFIREVNRERGVTVLLTTHDLLDVERLCRRVMIIDHGSLLYDGALMGLQERFGGERRLVVDYSQLPLSPEVTGTTLLAQEGLRVTYGFQAQSAAEVIARVTAGAPVRDLSVLEPDLEGTIRRIYEGGLLRPGLD
ncbi:ATP-binding cassette domain-containing protein [Deinococcus sp. KNUC1210]|uniref:ABC transporter ATP-binding protein n=1 Tax=Deinococcus sp. KNUC1210 TaxID=2917691 RepID=UPI001EEF9C40|nr:ATP-binding cassette domain-containing protein [Deinococcus sp. KNUC1210]ULH15505.1 ATP-binding cassette domain-containing protein [Deinococcus sp. KNUC1210]